MKAIFLFFLNFIIFPLAKFWIEKVEGKENIPQNGAFIVASNHINTWDHFLIAFVLRERIKEIHFVGAVEKSFSFPFSALLYYFSDTISLKRKNFDRENFLKKTISYLQSGKIIVIYPEGTTNRKKELLRGKTGAVDLAFRAKVPLIPVGMTRGKGFFKRIIRIGRPLYFEKESKEEDYALFLRKNTDMIMREISKLCQKPYPYG